MRLVPLLAALAACAPSEPSGLVYRSTLDATTRGVALHDGLVGHAGMYGTNCPFETEAGHVTGDYQLPGDGETVEDAGESPLGPHSVLLVLDDTVWFLDKTTGSYVVDDFEVPGLLAGRFTGAGTAILRGGASGCALDWNDTTHATLATVDLPSCPADEGFDVDPSSGLAVVAAPSGVALFGADGTRVDVEGDANLAAWDAGGDLTYLATAGGSELRAVTADGALAWTADLGGPIQGIGPAGAPGGVAVTVTDGDAGALVLFDLSGAELAVIDTPSAAVGVRSSPDGAVLAAIRPDHVYFFDVDRGALP